MNKIICKSINKKYGNNIILNNFNMQIEKGEMIAICGESGSGKSTLLNIIGLLDKPDSGDIIIDNIRNSKINSKQATLLQRNIIGYLFQNYALVDNMTVSKNLDIALEYYKDKDKNKKKMDALKEVKLESKLNNKVYELSGGEQQRVAIARLILKPCEIILADEPTGSLDKHNKDLVMDLLKKLNNNGKTMIIVTHDKDVSERCDRIINI